MPRTAIRLPVKLYVRQPRSGILRIPFLQPCQLASASGEQTGLVCDLSTAGVYVRLDRLPPPGERVDVSFQLFPGDPLPLQAQAEVAWVNEPESPRLPDLPPGCGLRFLHMSPEDALRVSELVKAALTPAPHRA